MESCAVTGSSPSSSRSSPEAPRRRCGWPTVSGRRAYALASNLVYRLELGAVLVGVVYASLVTLRLAWTGQTFTKFTAGPAGAEASPAVESAAQDIDDLRDDMTAFTGDLSLALERISVRLERLEAEPPG